MHSSLVHFYYRTGICYYDMSCIKIGKNYLEAFSNYTPICIQIEKKNTEAFIYTYIYFAIAINYNFNNLCISNKNMYLHKGD